VGHDSSAIAGSGAATESRSAKRLVSYTAADRERWKVEVSCISAVALCTISLMPPSLKCFHSNGQEVHQPAYRSSLARSQPQQTQSHNAATTFQRIVLDRGASGKVSGTLAGEGKAYIVDLPKAQLMKLDLQANPKVLLSVYSPPARLSSTRRLKRHAWLGTRLFYNSSSQQHQAVDYISSRSPENFTSAPSDEPSPHPCTLTERLSNY